MSLFSLVLENKEARELSVGTMILIESGKARAFDPLSDDVNNVIGVIRTNKRTFGRLGESMRGPIYYLNDMILWNESLEYIPDESGSVISNPNYVSFDPKVDTEHYSCISTEGMAAVHKSYTSVPDRWKLLHSGVVFDWYLLR